MQFNNSTSTKMKTKNMTTLHLRKSIGRSPLRLGFLLIPLLSTCFALSPTQAATPPPPPPPLDEGLPNGNTAEGNGALFSLTTGANNTAMGFDALYSLTSSNGNTALGDHALYTMTDAAKFGFGVNTAIGADAR